MDDLESHLLFDLVGKDKNVMLVRELLDWGVNPNLGEPSLRKGGKQSRNTLLHVAAKSVENNAEIVKALIEAGADVNRRNELLFTPLFYAVIYRKLRVVEALLQTRILKINKKDKFGLTALHYAINNNPEHLVHSRDLPSHARVPDLRIIKALLDHDHVNVNRKDILRETPLMWAVKDKRLDIVMLLLNKGARLDCHDEFEQTVLHMALTQQDPCPYIVVLLLQKRASLFKMSYLDETPINIIMQSNSFRFACICLKVIAFTYNDVTGILKRKLLKFPELTQFLNLCCDEIDRMKSDIVANVFTVYDFFVKCVPPFRFRNPVLQIYKPVVERLIVGLYRVYFSYIFHRISKSNLFAVLGAVIDRRYCREKMCDAKGCKKGHPTQFSKIVRKSALSAYLSCSDIFHLILVFTRLKIDKSILNICERECYLTDSWEEYPDTYFY